MRKKMRRSKVKGKDKKVGGREGEHNFNKPSKACYN